MLAAKELEMAWILLVVVAELVVDVSQAVSKLAMLDDSIVRWKATKASVLARLLDLMAALLVCLLVVEVDTKYSSVLPLSTAMIDMSRSGSEPPNAARSSKSGRKSASSWSESSDERRVAVVPALRARWWEGTDESSSFRRPMKNWETDEEVMVLLLLRVVWIVLGIDSAFFSDGSALCVDWRDDR